jgi:hypothetical protein
MPDEVFGLKREDVERLKKALAFFESFQRKQDIRRPRMPATAEGLNYVYGTLAEALPFQDTVADMTLDTTLDDATSTVEVYGRWFSAESGDEIGCLYDPFNERFDACFKVCPEDPAADSIDGGTAAASGGTEDGGTPAAGSGDLDGGTP